jgi:hypothetical protein
VRIHRIAEHALQLEPADRGLEPPDVALDLGDCRRVVLALGELEQLLGIADRPGCAVDGLDLRGEPRAFPAELLGLLRQRPDGRILELAGYFLEPLFLGVVLKETPLRSWCAPRDL